MCTCDSEVIRGSIVIVSRIRACLLYAQGRDFAVKVENCQKTTIKLECCTTAIVELHFGDLVLRRKPPKPPLALYSRSGF